jgi:hypothetical protein
MQKQSLDVIALNSKNGHSEQNSSLTPRNRKPATNNTKASTSIQNQSSNDEASQS